MSKIYQYKIVISPNHLDFMGHVNNATYLQLLEEARWGLYARYGYSQETVIKERNGPIIIEANLKYRKELVLNETIIIETEVLEYSNILGKMAQTIFNENGKKACTAEIVFGMFDLNKRNLVRPSGFWKKIHQQMV